MAETKRVIVDPITRIEGHLRIELELDEKGTVKDAYSSGTAFRGIEIIMRGRDPRDLGLFAQRICGVCTYHHYERGVEAVEDAFDVRIPPTPAWCAISSGRPRSCRTIPRTSTSSTPWTGGTC